MATRFCFTVGLLAATSWAAARLPAQSADNPAAGSAGGVLDLLSTGLRPWRTPTGAWTVVGGAAPSSADPARLSTAAGTGVLVNGSEGRTGNLFSAAQHGDALVHVEFLIPKGSNSGVYLQGRYEVQVYDSFGVAKDQYPGIECGGLYPRWIDGHEVGGHTPLVNASLPPGQWQTFDIVFRAPRFDAAGRKTANARFVLVVHNGRIVHQNVEVTGPTRSAAYEDEKPLGPLMLQGDHGPVAYRNLRIVPLRME